MVQTLHVTAFLVVLLTSLTHAQTPEVVIDKGTDVVVGTTVNFYVQQYEVVVVIVDYFSGDGHVDSFCGDASGNENISIPYTFNVVGSFTPTIIIYDDTVTEIYRSSTTCNVWNPMADVTITANITDFLYGRDGWVRFDVVLADPPNALLPMVDVNCTVTFPDDEKVILNAGNISDSSWTAFVDRNLGIIKPALSDNQPTLINCSSVVDSSSAAAWIFYASPMSNLTLAMDIGPPFGVTDEDLVFRIKANGGELGVSYVFQATNYHATWTDTGTVDFTHTVPALMASGERSAVVYGDDSAANLTATLDFYLLNRVVGMQLTGPLTLTTPDVSITYTLSLVDNAMPLPPMNVSCNWTMADGTTYDQFLGDIVSGDTFTQSHDMDPTLGGVQETAVSCHNGASDQPMTIAFQLMRAVILPEMYPNKTVELTDTEVSFVINATFGDVDVVYEIDWGDQIMDVYYRSSHVDHMRTHPFFTPGVYYPTLFVQDVSYSYEVRSQPVFIRYPIIGVTLSVNTTHTIPDGYVSYSVASDVTDPPTNVTCVLHLPDNTTYEVYQENFTEWYYHKVYDAQYAGYHEVTVNCTNEASYGDDSLVVILAEKVINLTIVAERYWGITDDIFEYNITADAGWIDMYVVDFDDGDTYTYIPTYNYTHNFTINHTFAAPGYYNVSVTATTLVEVVTKYISELMRVLTIIPPLLLETDSPRPVPDGIVTATITATDVTWLPVGVIIVLSPELEPNVTEDLQDVDMVNVGHVTTIPYRSLSIGDTQVSLYAYNEISSVWNFTTVRIIEIITVPTLVADKYFAIVDENVDFTISVTNGSHINYTLTFPDDPNAGAPFTDYYTPALLLNRQSIFTHSFVAEGTYTATGDVSNWFSAETSTIEQDVVVEYVMPDVVIMSNTPLLTPPGFIEFNMTAIDASLPTPAHIHCSWILGDEEGTRIDPHYDPLVMPVEESFRYFPNRDTIHTVLTSNLNCSNFISSVEATTETEIIPDYIKLGDLYDSGPSQPGEDVLFTLIIRNYAYDTCFYWNFTNVQYLTLFGGSHCPAFKPWAFDEFIEIPIGEYPPNITYTKQFIPEEVHVLEVYAENSISDDFVRWEFLIMPEVCDPPTVNLGAVGRSPRSIRLERQDVPFPIIGSVILFCDTDVSFIYYWTFTKFNGTHFSENMDIIQPNSTDFIYIPGSLETGDYEVTLHVTMTFLPIPVNNSDTIYIRILPAILSLTLLGGDRRQMSLSDGQITISSHAFDPMDPQEGPNGIDFKWHCEEYSGGTLPSVNWGSFADVDCLSLTGADTNGSHLFVPSSLLTGGTELFVAAYVEKPFRDSAEASQIEVLVSAAALELEIWCERNCMELVNPASVLILAGNCLNCEANDVPVYSWNVTQLGANDEVLAWMPVTTNTLDLLHPRSTIAPHLLIEGAVYRFTLDGVSSDGTRLGMASLDKRVNLPPYGGTCELPAQTMQGMEKYSVVCSDWMDDELELDLRRKRAADDPLIGTLLYEIYVISPLNESMLAAYGVDPTFPPGYFPFYENGTLKIDGFVFDSYLSFASDDAAALLLPVPNATEKAPSWLYEAKKLADAQALQDLLQLIMAIMALVDAGEIPELLTITPFEYFQLFGMNLTEPEVNGTTTEIPTTTTEYMTTTESLDNTTAGVVEPPHVPGPLDVWVREFFVDLMADMNIASPTQILQMASALQAVASKAPPLTEHAVDGILNIVLHETDLLDAVAEYASPEYIDTTALKLLDVTATCLESETAIPLDIQQQIEECWEILIDCDVNALVAEGVEDQIMRLNNITGNFTAVFSAIMDLYLDDMAPGVPFLTREVDGLEIVTGMVRDDNIPGLEVASSMGSVTMPTADMFPELDDNSCMDVKYVAFQRNPWQLIPYGTFITTPVQQLWFEDCDTQEVLIPEPADPNDPYWATAYTGKEPSNGTFTELNDTKEELALHDFIYPNQAFSVQLFFTPGQEGMIFNIYVSYNTTPDNGHYEYTTVLGYREEIDPFTEEIIYPTSTETLTYILPRNYTNYTGLYIVAVMIEALPDFEIVETNYTFDVNFLVCGQVVEEYQMEWDVFTCESSTQSNASQVVFSSTLFSSTFGAGLLIAPNMIDFGSVFDNFAENLVDNIAVFCVLCGLIIIYLILVPQARKRDRKDQLGWTPLPILMYVPSDPFHYEVHVYTGIDVGAGTESNVYIKIAGVQGDTGQLQLDDEKRKNFQRGAKEKFIVSSPKDLGKLKYIKISHDNSGEGKKAAWFLDKILIYDKQTNKRYLFLCDEWIALEKGTGRLEKVIPLATREEVYQSWSMLRRRYKKHMFEDHMFMSVFMRQEEDHFTRCQRLGCAFALLFMNMIANAMWYQADSASDLVNGIQLGPFSFTLQTLMTSIYAILTAYPVCLLVVLFFEKAGPKKSKKEPKEDEDDHEANAMALEKDDCTVTDIEMEDTSNTDAPQETDGSVTDDEKELVRDGEPEKKKKNPRPLPHWIIYINWFLIFCIFFLSSFFTMLYSFTWGGERSSAWLGAFFLSTFEGNGLIDPSKALMVAMIMSMCLRKPVDDVSALSLDDDLEFREEEGADPDAALETLRKRRILDIRIKQVSRQLVFHVIFLIALLLVTSSNRDSRSFMANEEIRTSLTGSTFYTTMSTPANMITWLQVVALPVIFPQTAYNGDTLGGYDKKFMDDFADYRLGPVMLRQYRVIPDFCVPPDRESLEGISCNVDLNDDTQDTGTYYPHWGTEHNDSYPLPRNMDLFEYAVEAELDTTFYGWFQTYNGGGYVASLGSSMPSAMNKLVTLDDLTWIDRYTRAIVLEFNIYNANVNLFSMVTAVFEFPSFGGCLADLNIDTLTLYEYFGPYGVFALASEIIVIICILAFTIRMFYNMCRQRKEYFRSMWNYFEILKLACGMVAIGVFIHRIIRIQVTVEYMMNNRGDAVSFASVSFANETFIFFIAVALFLQILQLLWILGFTKAIAVFESTLRNTLLPLASFALCFLVVFIGFWGWSYIIYVHWLYEYRDPLHASYQQTAAMLGSFDTDAVYAAAGVAGRVNFFIYEVFMMFIILNLLITILMDIHADVAEGNFEIRKDYELVDVMMDRFREGLKKAQKREVQEIDYSSDQETFDADDLDLKELLVYIREELAALENAKDKAELLAEEKQEPSAPQEDLTGMQEPSAPQKDLVDNPNEVQQQDPNTQEDSPLVNDLPPENNAETDPPAESEESPLEEKPNVPGTTHDDDDYDDSAL